MLDIEQIKLEIIEKLKPQSTQTFNAILTNI